MADREPNAQSKYLGMTVNERLFAAGLLNAFDQAARSGEKERMIEILVQVEIDPQGATRTADSILAHPTRFGRIENTKEMPK